MSDEDDSYKTSLMGERVMKSKNIVIVAGWLCILTFLAGCSAVGTMSTEEDTTVKSLVPQDGKALVYFMRPSGFGTAVKMRVTMGSGDYLGATGGGRYIYSLLDPGNYTFRSKAENASLLTPARATSSNQAEHPRPANKRPELYRVRQFVPREVDDLRPS